MRVQKLLREYTFVIFCSLMLLFTVFVYRNVPETKNRTFEEIASQFQPGGDIDVEEIINDEDDVFGTFSPPSDVTPPTTSLPSRTPDDDDQQFWIIHL